MKISEIKTCPNTLSLDKNSGRYHESIFRSYQILEKTKTLLSQNTPAEVILEIIEEIEAAEGIDRKFKPTNAPG